MTRVAIVLGAAVRPDGTATPALRRRAKAAAELFNNGEIDEIIVSGGVPQAGKSEADLMCDICNQAGVPLGAITKEDASRNTLENIRNSLPLIPKDSSFTLVTDRYHRWRALLIAREFGLQARCVSPQLEPRSNYMVMRAYLREAAAIAVYGFGWAKRLNSRPSR